MSEETQLATAPIESRITFVQDPKKHPLAKTLKKLEGHLDEAIALVVECINNKEMTPKDRMDAAKFLIEKRITLGETISKETLSRQVLEMRMLQGAGPVRPPKDVEGEEDKPKVLFVKDQILKVDNITNM